MMVMINEWIWTNELLHYLFIIIFIYDVDDKYLSMYVLDLL